MIVSFKLEHKGWGVEWYTRYVDAVDASWLQALLNTLADTEGLKLAFYYSEEEFLEAVERTVRESEFWRMYQDTSIVLHAPMCGGHVLLAMTKGPEDDATFEVPF